MKKFIFILGLFAFFSFSYANDSDLDGVPDGIDKCPGTLFLQTVDKYGCSKQQYMKKEPVSFYISAGIEHDNYKSYSSQNILFTGLTVKKNNLKANLFYSLKDSDGYKSNDLIVSGYYYESFENSVLKLGAKMYLPTYFNDKTDYAFLVKGIFFLKECSLSISEKHKIYTESGTNAKDTITLSIEKRVKKIYLSPYFYIENSKYDKAEWYKYIGISSMYQLNKNISLILDLSADVEELQNNSVIGSVGYSF